MTDPESTASPRILFIRESWSVRERVHFFARQVLINLPPSLLPAVGLVAVASPTSYTGLPASPANTWFVQLYHDAIACVPGSPAGDVSNDLDAFATYAPCDSRESGLAMSMHSFSDSYLAYQTTRSAIVTAVADGIAAASNSRALAGQGYFQVTATWNIDGDADLHVVEPTGTHVYWRHKQGDVGTLDRDDTVYSGPENYFVCSPSSVVQGTYDISVNNFDATAGTIVTITVRAGSQVHTYYRILDNANVGSNLIPVVTVTYAGAGKFTFSTIN